MRPNKILTPITLVVAVAIAGLFSAKIAPRAVAQLVAQNVAVPSSIAYRDTAYDPGGKVARIDEYVNEQRSNGDRVQIWSDFADGNRNRIIDFVSSGLTVSTNDKNSYTSTLGRGRARILVPNYLCTTIDYSSNSTTVGQEKVLGFTVTHYRTNGANEVKERWIAGDDLGCVVLKTVHQWKDDDGLLTGAVTVSEAVKVTPGAPPEADFRLPANPVDLPPSQYNKNIHPEQAENASLTRMDAIYQGLKVARASAK